VSEVLFFICFRMNLSSVVYLEVCIIHVGSLECTFYEFHPKQERSQMTDSKYYQRIAEEAAREADQTSMDRTDMARILECL
jgi:hypothetical protein